MFSINIYGTDCKDTEENFKRNHNFNNSFYGGLKLKETTKMSIILWHNQPFGYSATTGSMHHPDQTS